MMLMHDTRLLKAIAFAAEKHRFQKRKDGAGTPYINHPIQVALTLAEIGTETYVEILMAAVLHDTLEDTQTTPEELEAHFGQAVAGWVQEVTDDKRLPKEERKRLQVVLAPSKSREALKIKLADKICNVVDILHHPPAGWGSSQKLEYLDWAAQICLAARGTQAALESHLNMLIETGRQEFASTVAPTAV